MADHLDRIIDRMDRLTDEQLIEVLDNPTQFKPEALAIAEEEASTREGLRYYLRKRAQDEANCLDVGFRVAESRDWEFIWPIFRDTVATSDSFMFHPDTSEANARRIWMPGSAGQVHTYVAELNGAIVGSAFVKPTQPGLGDHIANAGWMMDRSVRGMGIGRRFAVWVIEQAALLGFTGMQFNAVVSTNTPAVRLWESLGFKIVGTVPQAFRHVDHGPVDIHIMFKTLP